jgi:hypothetical protein
MYSFLSTPAREGSIHNRVLWPLFCFIRELVGLESEESMKDTQTRRLFSRCVIQIIVDLPGICQIVQSQTLPRRRTKP